MRVSPEVYGVYSSSASGSLLLVNFGAQLAVVVQKLVANPSWAKWLSIVAIVLGVSILVDSLFERIQRILERGVLGWVNHLLGLGFGIASGGLVIAFALILLNTYGPDGFKNEIANSRFAPRLTDIGDRVWAVSKEQVQKQLDTNENLSLRFRALWTCGVCTTSRFLMHTSLTC